MEKEKIVAVLLILAILFSIASIVFNLSIGEVGQKDNTNNGDVIAGNPSGGVNIVIEQNPSAGAGK